MHGLFGLPVFVSHNMEETADKEMVFHFIKGMLGLTCAVGEVLFCQAIRTRYGTRTGYLTFLFLSINSGMFHSATSLLPSSSCMIAVLYGYAAWLHEQHIAGLFVGAYAVLFCWPFVALMFIPMGIDSLYNKGIVPVTTSAMISMVVFTAIPSLLESYLYGERIFPILNLVMYNSFGHGGNGQGADLYGTEPWYFYIQNLVLNLNLIFVMAVFAPLFLVFIYNKPTQGTSGFQTFLYLSAGIFTTVFFSCMAHKEERFLSMVYPIICFGAALNLDQIISFTTRLFDKQTPTIIVKLLSVLIVVLIVFISMSRNAALVYSFAAPQQVYHELSIIPNDEPVQVCVGKEWYRFPSSFFLPKNVEIVWVKSGFDGQLPQKFSKWPGTHIRHTHFNDINKEEPKSYAHPASCEYAIDLAVGDDNGDIGQWEGRWSKVVCRPFLDAGSSPAFIRSFFIPFNVSTSHNVYAEYCLLKKI